MPKSSRVQERKRMRTALAFWRRSQVSASTSARVHYRPDEINWMHVVLKFGLGLLLLGNLAAPFAARAQNLGTSPQFGQAVQGQQATTVEGTVLNIVNWGSYTITPEALMSLYKQHHADVLKRGIPTQALFEAYVQYCFSPKHTVGEQLLDVRRDKRERAAYAAATGGEAAGDEEEEDDDERFGITMAELGGLAGCEQSRDE
jgi:hypothetical protein